jgi:hypothetical protein
LQNPHNGFVTHDVRLLINGRAKVTLLRLPLPTKIVKQNNTMSLQEFQSLVPPIRKAQMLDGTLWHLKAGHITFGVASLAHLLIMGKRGLSSWSRHHHQQLYTNALTAQEIFWCSEHLWQTWMLCRACGKSQ